MAKSLLIGDSDYKRHKEMLIKKRIDFAEAEEGDLIVVTATGGWAASLRAYFDREGALVRVVQP